MNSDISGFLLVNKPSGPTTYDLIRWLKRSIQGIKIGHSGTLDPLATGLVILLLGRATKSQDQYMKKDKLYSGSFELGRKTNTGDNTGQTILEKPIPPLTEQKLKETFVSFVGERHQTPPMYSAKKVNGKPLYKLARSGKSVDRMPVPITIHSLNFKSVEGNNVEFKTRVSSGTYVRVLVEDIGESLGSCATMTSLCREAIGEFSLMDSIPGEDLKTITHETLQSHLKGVPVYG